MSDQPGTQQNALTLLMLLECEDHRTKSETNLDQINIFLMLISVH